MSPLYHAYLKDMSDSAAMGEEKTVADGKIPASAYQLPGRKSLPRPLGQV